MALTEDEKKARKAAYDKKYREDNKEAVAARKKQWCEANKEAVVAKQKEHYEANKEELLAKQKEHYEANKEELLAKQKEYREDNKEVIAAWHKEYREDNKEAIAAKAKIQYEANKEAILAQKKEYREDNKEAILAREKEYREDNKEAIAARKKQWYEANPAWVSMRSMFDRLKSAMERRLSDSSNGGLVNKRKSTSLKEIEVLLGYTVEQLHAHIESHFKDDMTWANRSKWHIDHIKPVSLMLNEGETDPAVIHALSNLQPLWAKDNMAKNSSYDPAVDLPLEVAC